VVRWGRAPAAPTTSVCAHGRSRKPKLVSRNGLADINVTMVTRATIALLFSVAICSGCGSSDRSTTAKSRSTEAPTASDSSPGHHSVSTSSAIPTQAPTTSGSHTSGHVASTDPAPAATTSHAGRSTTRATKRHAASAQQQEPVSRATHSCTLALAGRKLRMPCRVRAEILAASKRAHRARSTHRPSGILGLQ
jgi:hypothetical protein